MIQYYTWETFFDKGNLLISRRYQLYPASALAQCLKHQGCAHSKKEEKREIEKQRPHRGDTTLAIATF
jgi:hypothetical protein